MGFYWPPRNQDKQHNENRETMNFSNCSLFLANLIMMYGILGLILLHYYHLGNQRNYYDYCFDKGTFLFIHTLWRKFMKLYFAIGFELLMSLLNFFGSRIDFFPFFCFRKTFHQLLQLANNISIVALEKQSNVIIFMNLFWNENQTNIKGN